MWISPGFLWMLLATGAAGVSWLAWRRWRFHRRVHFISSYAFPPELLAALEERRRQEKWHPHAPRAALAGLREYLLLHLGSPRPASEALALPSRIATEAFVLFSAQPRFGDFCRSAYGCAPPPPPSHEEFQQGCHRTRRAWQRIHRLAADYLCATSSPGNPFLFVLDASFGVAEAKLPVHPDSPTPPSVSSPLQETQAESV